MGTKTRRGWFGATLNMGNETIYCARPGMRIWRSNLNGKVGNHTLYQHIQEFITTFQVVATLKLKEIFDDQGVSEGDLSFSKLHLVPDLGLLLSFSGEMLFLVDPEDLKESIATQWAESRDGATIQDAFAVGR